jgi:hypothetical protein
MAERNTGTYGPGECSRSRRDVHASVNASGSIGSRAGAPKGNSS